MVRRALPWVAAAAIVVIAFGRGEVTRGPAFHHYADGRSLLGIPNAGDVLSNLAFVVAGFAFLHRLRGIARVAGFGVVAIGIGSAAYHIAPSDATLAFDWAPIAITLSLVVAAVIEDRHGTKAGTLAALIGPLVAATAVVWWWAGGGTTGGNMTPYGAAQAAGIALAPLIAFAAPGKVPARHLLVAVAVFAIARVCAAFDEELLGVAGISGHSLKHLAAAGAAALTLRALRISSTS